MSLDAFLVDKVSSKSGKEYTCVEIFITDKVKKIVYLTDAEIELVRLYYSSSSN